MGKRLNIMDDAHLRRVVEYSAGARLIVGHPAAFTPSMRTATETWLSSWPCWSTIAATTGASVLYLHHVSKGSAREGQTDQQQAARGVRTDRQRRVVYVARMTEDEAKRLSDRNDRQPIGKERRPASLRAFRRQQKNYDATQLDRWYLRARAVFWCRWTCMGQPGRKRT